MGAELMGFDFNTWAESFGRAWSDAWGRSALQDPERVVPTANIRKEEFFEEELFLMLYATKY